jgi:hypothetical protein
MNYYRRYNGDGTWEIICTRCFLSLGTANGISAAMEMETRHFCAAEASQDISSGTLPSHNSPLNHPTSTLSFIDRLLATAPKKQSLHVPLMLLSAVLLIYVLPTALELVATQHISPWLASIFPGDLAGCICLAAVFKMRRTGVLLYLLLTICETFLYLSNIVSARELPWIVDLVPTLIVAGAIARARSVTGLRSSVLN